MARRPCGSKVKLLIPTVFELVINSVCLNAAKQLMKRVKSAPGALALRQRSLQAASPSLPCWKDNQESSVGFYQQNFKGKERGMTHQTNNE